MRLAVVLHVPTVGGVTRFTQALVAGVLEADPDLEIGLFLNSELVKSGEFSSIAGSPRVDVVAVDDPSLTTSARAVVVTPNDVVRGRLWRCVRALVGRWPRLHATSVGIIVGLRRFLGRDKPWYFFSLARDVVDSLSAYDVVYLAFPYYLRPASIAPPCVGTFHDVNQKHFPHNFGPELVSLLDRQIPFWLERCTSVVTSTHFMERDLARHYPQASGKTEVVLVAPYSHLPVSSSVEDQLLSAHGLEPGRYIVYPASIAHHKNVLTLVQAANVLRRTYPGWNVPVVITGGGTQEIGDFASTHAYVPSVNAFLKSSSLRVGVDVLGLGYVSDEEVDALTRRAGLVCSTSLYEAGCGPALDAWQFGVPVAFSAIPPFVEQMEALGTFAWTFDPTDPSDVARAIAAVFDDPEQSQRKALESARAIARYTWADAAREYLRIFEGAARRGT